MLLKLLWLLQPTAWACAGLYHDEDSLAESDAQEVIFSQTPDGVRTAYRVEYDGDADDFGWLIPIFGEFSSLEEADEAEFDDLRAWSQPTVSRRYGSDSGGDDGGRGCRGGAKSGGLEEDRANFSDTGSDNGVTVVAEGFTGAYAYQVLSATDSDAFLGWLDENGWTGGGTEPAITAYVEAGGVQFVALRLTDVGGQTPPEGRQLPPVAITTAGDALRFPSTMARYGMASRQHTVVYVRGDGQAEAVDPWTASPLGELHGSLDDDPAQLYLDALWDVAGEQPGWGLIFSGPAPEGDGWLTRFETYAGRDAHTSDALFTLTSTETRANTLIVLEEGHSERRSGASAVWLLGLGLGVGLGVGRRHRHRHAT